MQSFQKNLQRHAPACRPKPGFRHASNCPAPDMKRLDSKFEEIAASIPSKFTIACLDDWSAVAPDVQRLFDQAEAASFDLGLDWFRHLAATAMRPATETCIYVVSAMSNGQAVAALPVRRDRGGKQLFSLANYYTSLYAPLVRSDDAEAALGALFAQLLRGVNKGTTDIAVFNEAFVIRKTRFLTVSHCGNIAGIRYGDHHIRINRG